MAIKYALMRPNKNAPKANVYFRLPFVFDPWVQSIEDNFKWVEIKGQGNLLSRRTGKWLAPGTNPYFRLYGAFIFRFTIENYFRRKPFRWLSIKGFEKLAKKDKNYRQRYLKLIQKQPFGWATSRKGKTPIWNRPTMELLEYLEIEKPKIIDKV